MINSTRNLADVMLCNTTECNLNKLQRIQNTLADWQVLPVNLLVHLVLLASGSHYTGYQLDNALFIKTALITYKALKTAQPVYLCIYVTCFIIINQLVL